MLNIEQDINIIASNCSEILFNHIKDHQEADSEPLHTHDFCELYLYTAGDIGYYIEGNFYDLKYGDIVIIRQNEIHRSLIRKRCEYERFFIKFPLNAFNVLTSDVVSPMRFITERSISDGRLIRLPDASRNEVITNFYKISELIQTKPSCWKTLAYSYLLQLLTVIHICLESRENMEAESKFPILMQQIIGYIDVDFATLGSEKEIAERFGITNSYLSRLFKRYMSISFAQYLNTKRISYAKALLSKGLSVTDVCYECGFSDCSHFIAVFKRYVGVTPNKFKHCNYDQLKNCEPHCCIVKHCN